MPQLVVAEIQVDEITQTAYRRGDTSLEPVVVEIQVSQVAEIAQGGRYWPIQFVRVEVQVLQILEVGQGGWDGAHERIVGQEQVAEHSEISQCRRN